ncbi:purine-cytosine permease family protein [Mycolicibacterium sp.]|uniref:purine-cytosine permease family protein n=1 Tax=Mycolicibacterium sp. TaxID=2320850 RepID=UPI0037CAD047
MPERNDAAATASTTPPPGWAVTDHDDPAVISRQAHEDYTDHVVPLTARQSRLTVLGGWWSIASAMAFLYYGALAATLAGTRQALTGLVLVIVVYSLLGAVVSNASVVRGVNSMLLTREIFGVRGAALTPLICGLGAIYYAVFESSVMASALQAYFQVFDIRVWYAIVIVGMLPLMLGGMQTWLNKLNNATLPIYVCGVAAAVIVAGVRFGWSGDWFTAHPQPADTTIPGWLSTFVLFMGIWLLIPDTAEFARFGRLRDKRFHSNVTFGWAFYLLAFGFNGVAGILIVALAAPNTTIAESAVTTGIVASLGVVGLLVVIVSQIRINSANFYVASLCLERVAGHLFTRNLSRRAWVLLLAVITFLLMLTKVFTYITTALAWQGIITVAWVGIVTVHLLLVTATPEIRSCRLTAVSRGLVIWAISAAIGLVAMEFGVGMISSLAPLIALLTSVVLYLTQVPALRRGAHRPGDTDQRQSAGDLWSTRIRCGCCGLHYTTYEMDTVPLQPDRPLCLECQPYPASRAAVPTQ